MSDLVTVHLVDDDPAFRESLRLVLKGLGFAVAEYPDAQSFASQADTATGCALVDVNMPGLDGIALQEMLTERGITIPLVVMTGDADVPMAVKAMRAGAVDFIEKPFDLPELQTAIDRALKRPLPPAANDPEAALFKTKLDGLSPREREILEAVVAGHPTKVIAYRLGISPRTVDAHRLRIGDKLGVTGLSNLVRLALAAGVKPSLSRRD